MTSSGTIRHRILLASLVASIQFGTIQGVYGQNATSSPKETTPNEQASINLGTVPVTSDSPGSDGSSAESGGFYVPTPTFGPFGPVSSLELPFSVNSIPQEVIRDQQAVNLEQAARNDASFGNYAPTNATGYADFTIRGFATDNPTNNRIDGLPVTSQSGILLQDYERVDIYKGLAGLLYGFTSPGGLVNYVSKLPTDTALTEISATYQSDSQFGGGLDVSRRFGPDSQFGIRVNAAGSSGDEAIDDSSNKNYVVALAADWRPREGAKVWLNANYSRNAYYGLQPGLFIGTLPIPSPPKADQFLGLPFSQHIGTTRGIEGGAEADILPWLSARATIGDFWATRDVRYDGGTSVDAAGGYNLAIDPHNLWTLEDFSGEAMLTAHFDHGWLTSKTDLGFTSNQETTREYTIQDYEDLPGLSNIYHPIAIADPQQPVVAEDLYLDETTYRNMLLQETVGLGPMFSVIGAVAHSTIRFADNQTPQTTYYQSANDPSGAVIFKPTKEISIYASYIRGLEAGSRADTNVGAAPVSNANQLLPPFQSEQVEIGTKYQVTPGFMTSLAVFRTSRPIALYLPNDDAGTSFRYSADGQQINKGIEFTASGQITPDFKLFSGVTAIDPRIIHSQDGALDGKHAIGIAPVQANAFGEYAIRPVPGLTALAGVYYTGSKYVDSANTRTIPAATTFDLGAKYETVLASKRLTTRFYVTNVANKGYWDSSVYAPVLFLMDPRTFRLQVSVHL